jgi:hypothetical protein
MTVLQLDVRLRGTALLLPSNSHGKENNVQKMPTRALSVLALGALMGALAGLPATAAPADSSKGGHASSAGEAADSTIAVKAQRKALPAANPGLARASTCFVMGEELLSHYSPFQLARGQCIQRRNRTLEMQGDGNLVYYKTDSRALCFAAGTHNRDAYYAKYQTDGNLVVTKYLGEPLWASSTFDSRETTVSINHHGDLYIGYKRFVICRD